LNLPITSIIVPIYDAEKYLPCCLESLINQTFKDIEIICVIDGSVDNSLEICENYKNMDSRIIIITQENQGPSAARNTGLLYARGKYIQFCDPDDSYSHNMCEELYNAISSSDADIITSGTRIIYDHIKVHHGELEYFRVKSQGLKSINEVAFRITDVSVWNKLFKKTIIDTYKINFPQGLIYEDACFFYKYLFMSKTIYYIPEHLYNYTRHDKSIMSNTYKKKISFAKNHLLIMENIKTFMMDKKLNTCYEKDLFLLILIPAIYFYISYSIESFDSFITGLIKRLLGDITEDFILGCPYISRIEKLELISLKQCDIRNFSKLYAINNNPIKKIIKELILPFFPYGTKRRMILKKIINIRV
jgi:glycosyltransferase involved in cell wall biosynthesis